MKNSLDKSNTCILQFLALMLFLFLGCTEEPVITTTKSKTETVVYYLKSLDGKDAATKKYLINRAYEVSKKESKDSVKLKNLLKIAYEAYSVNDSLLFVKANKEGLLLAKKAKDTFSIADGNWNYGAFYGEKQVLDSSYYYYDEAYKNYKTLKNEFFEAKMLYNMAFIQSRIGDYANSETKIFQAIPKYKSLNKNTSLYRCYSLLGSIYGELEDYEVSLDYHNQAYEYLKISKNSDKFKGAYLNSLGVVNRQKEDYAAAKNAFQEGLQIKNLRKTDPKLFAKLYDNYGFTLLKNNEVDSVEDKLKVSLQIRQSNNYLSGIVISDLHLAEYYFMRGDTAKSIDLAVEANKMANKTRNKRDILMSLLLLSKLDSKNASNYLNEHIAISKQIDIDRRQLRNKVARISFETDTYIDKSEKLSLERQFILTISVGVLFVLSLLYYIRIQNAKNNELRLQQEQQEANEEIYKLLLKQQSKIEQGRLEERKRISEELHDGVLGKIFGTRMALGFLDISGSKEIKEEHDSYLDNLLHIEKEIRDISHQLKSDFLDGSGEYLDLIEDLIKEQAEIGKFKYNLDKNGSDYWNQASDSIKINCYRIVQEAVFNIIKHANASFVLFSFLYNDEYLNFSILDNGSGFDYSKTEKGIGLSNMKSRVESINGVIHIKSSKIGTSISVNVPISFIEKRNDIF